jgi:hypothetical protein
MAKLEAEIGRNLEHYAKRPKRMQLTATSAQGVDYAQYYDRLRRKIEARHERFPAENGKPIYGQLILVINVNRQGKLGYNRDGYNIEAIDVAKSSATRRSTARPWPSSVRPRRSARSRPRCSRSRTSSKSFPLSSSPAAGSTSACKAADDQQNSNRSTATWWWAIPSRTAARRPSTPRFRARPARPSSTTA